MTTIRLRRPLDNVIVNKEGNTLVGYTLTSSGVSGTETTGLEIVQTNNSGTFNNVHLALDWVMLTEEGGMRMRTDAWFEFNGLRKPIDTLAGTTIIDVTFGQYIIGNTISPNEASNKVEMIWPQTVLNFKIHLALAENTAKNFTWRWRMYNEGDSFGAGAIVSNGPTQTVTSSDSEWVPAGTGFKYEKTLDITTDILAALPDAYSTP